MTDLKKLLPKPTSRLLLPLASFIFAVLAAGATQARAESIQGASCSCSSQEIADSRGTTGAIGPVRFQETIPGANQQEYQCSITLESPLVLGKGMDTQGSRTFHFAGYVRDNKNKRNVAAETARAEILSELRIFLHPNDGVSDRKELRVSYVAQENGETRCLFKMDGKTYQPE